MNNYDLEFYFKEWYKRFFSTKPTDLSKSTSAIETAYLFYNYPIPKIYFAQSPLAARKILKETLFSKDDYVSLKGDLRYRLIHSGDEMDEKSYSKSEIINCLRNQERIILLCELILKHAVYFIKDIYNDPFYFDIFRWDFSIADLWLYDFHMSIPQDKSNVKIWNILRELCEQCPFILPFEDFCIIIDRPCEIHLDRESLIHAEAKGAIKYRDSYEIYCNHGISIPASYGKVHSSNWQLSWIVPETENEIEGDCELVHDSELIYTLLTSIGFQKFCQGVSIQKSLYWKNYKTLIGESTHIIFDWQLFHFHDLYWKSDDADCQQISNDNFQQLMKDTPVKISQELYHLYEFYNGKYQLAPKLYFHPLKQSIENIVSELDSYRLPLFHGDRQEIYYVLCDNEERLVSHVYCQFPNEEPAIYAECVTSLIITIAQCYQEGAYYIAIDEETGERSVQQDLDKIEPIFEKFNPDQIDTWRKIWKS